MSARIFTLDPHLAKQIAAGEVVERPLSVVKELVENALDAGASNIQVSLKNGGIDRIEVRDNGEGIAQEDISKALEKYSTSKIKSLQDLYEVMTFGFRGEALSSIASISKFFLSSKQASQTAGRSIRNTFQGSYIEADLAHEVGTLVRVDELFYNTPARLNYLKQARTEYLKILEFLQKISLVYPHISFSLSHDEKQVFFVSPEQNLLSRVRYVMGELFSENILSLETSFGGFRIFGVITNPKISFSQRNKQVIFVNNRLIQSPLISKAVNDAYKRYISHGSYPGYVLFIEVDPTQIDVNVHPRKMEVRFAQESTLFRSVYHSLEDTLKSVSLASVSGDNDLIDFKHLHGNIPQGTRVLYQHNTSSTSYYTGSGTKFKNYSPYTNREANPAQSGLAFTQAVIGTSREGNPGEFESHNLSDTPFGKIIGQVHNAYILVQTITGIMILDQHALAERVIYEKLASTSYIPKKQCLLTGVGLHLDITEYELFLEHESTLLQMGFEIEALSHQNIMIQTVPDFVKKQNIEILIRQILADISTLGSPGLQEVRNKIWSYTACRAAIKFGDPLTLFEMHALLRDASLDYTATCPHGRPVVYEVSLQDLQKKYDR